MSTPHIAFRCDASAVIGSGHVMRCLTLAKALVDRGVRCSFLCRDLPGHMMTRIAAEGHGVHALAAPTGQGDAHTADGDYAAWLGVSPAADAIESRAIMDMIRPDRVIVDHYALDADWEQAACPGIPVMAIDDLANRPHSCDILLDQNLGRQASDYDGLVPERALRLIGPSNALLRPEFAAARAEALARRTACSRVKALLITMGGMDRENVTGQILQRLKQISLASDSVIRVVMGGHAPWLNFVEEVAAQMPCSVEVLVDVADMAQLMVDSDLAIGATGSTSWERCCLGLPCISVTIKPATIFT